jgi:hypothetical protein
VEFCSGIAMPASERGELRAAPDGALVGLAATFDGAAA